MTVDVGRVDHYQVLGVARDATDADIRAAYRALIQRYHPDRNPDRDAARRSGEIVAAYSVLKNPVTRAQYDMTLRRPEPRLIEVAAAKGARRPPPRSKRQRIARWLRGLVHRRRHER